MRRLTVPDNIAKHNRTREELLAIVPVIKQKLTSFASSSPLVSVIIPAFNEEDNILKTLSSLADSATKCFFEVIVVNNNSSDNTAKLAEACGAFSVDEPVQGITAARNRGLSCARGEYVMNADADTIYPPMWIDLMLAPLHLTITAIVYGSHYFLPSTAAERPAYFIYELAADMVKWFKRTAREEAVNVYGFNSAFRRHEGLAVEGFNHPEGTNEDGWLAIKLRERFEKKLFFQRDRRAMVWTSNRRLQADGGLWRAAVKRFYRLAK